jgi:hypothetical protein
MYVNEVKKPTFYCDDCCSFGGRFCHGEASGSAGSEKQIDRLIYNNEASILVQKIYETINLNLRNKPRVKNCIASSEFVGLGFAEIHELATEAIKLIQKLSDSI